jgi:hypothetical protein
MVANDDSPVAAWELTNQFVPVCRSSSSQYRGTKRSNEFSPKDRLGMTHARRGTSSRYSYIHLTASVLQYIAKNLKTDLTKIRNVVHGRIGGEPITFVIAGASCYNTSGHSKPNPYLVGAKNEADTFLRLSIN